VKRFNEILKNIFFFLTPSSAENFKVVVLCILAATTFWFFTALNKTYTTRINYPIKFNYESAGLVAVKELPENVVVDVTGGGWNLLRRTFWWKISPINIPLENPTNVRYIKGAALYPEIGAHLSELKLNYVATDTLYFDIQNTISKKFKLWLNDSSISLNDNYRITSEITLSRDSVLVTGPEKLVNELPKTIEINVNEKGINRSFSEKVKIPSFENALIKIEPKETEVSFEVTRFITKEIEVQVRKIGFTEELSKRLPNVAMVLLTVKETEQKDWESSDFEVLVYKKSLNWSDSTVKLILTKYPSEIQEIALKEPKPKLKYE